MSGKTFELACVFIHDTDDAILVMNPADDEEVWIPLSQVEEIHRDKDGTTGHIVMTEWIARKKGLL